MYSALNETIQVAGVYKRHTFIPKKFRWKSKTYPIQEITLTSDVKDGGVKKRYYSVVSEDNLYRLEFNLDTEEWILREVWVE